MPHLIAILLLLCMLLEPASPAAAQSSTLQPAISPAAERADRSVRWLESAFSLTAGYRHDDLRWSIAGNLHGDSPDVQSELEWSDIEIYQIKLANRSVIHDRLYLRWHLGYGTVASGDNRDSDYRGDHRTDEYSRSINGVDGNAVWDASIGIGPRFTFFDAAVAVCPVLGYAVSKQDFNIVDGFQVLTDDPAQRPLGPITGLDSTYETRWRGPWLGVDLNLSTPLSRGPFTELGITISAAYHWIDYDADADWNLREEYRHPTSFTHTAKGHGLTAETIIGLAIDRQWRFTVGINVTRMRTDPGEDRVYFTDGTIAETRLNEVRWRSMGIEAGVGYRF